MRALVGAQASGPAGEKRTPKRKRTTEEGEGKRRRKSEEGESEGSHDGDEGDDEEDDEEEDILTVVPNPSRVIHAASLLC